MDLKVARQIAGLTQQELARRSGVDDAVICELETERRDIYRLKYSDVVHLAQALGVEVTVLFPVTPIVPPLPRLPGVDETGESSDATQS